MSKRVFLSYSRGSNEHDARVLALAEQLRGAGIEAWLDQYEPSPREGWPRWLRTQLASADFTLVVCTPTYRLHFEGGPDTIDHAVGSTWAWMIAHQLLYDASSLDTKMIPVLFEDGAYEDIPLALRSFDHYRLPADFVRLVRRITGQLEATPPPLGAPPELAPTRVPRPAAARSRPGRPPMSGSRSKASDEPVPREILLFTANATDSRLHLEEELRAILDALARARARAHYQPRISPAATFSQIVIDLDERRPALVHFSGHGDAGGLMLATRHRPVARVSPEDIVELFDVLNYPVELVVLAACETVSLAEAVVSHVEAAIGWSGEIDDLVVQQFSREFYERLAATPTPDVARAFNLTRVAMRGSGIPEIDQAHLFLASPPTRAKQRRERTRYAWETHIDVYTRRLTDVGIDAELAKRLAEIMRPDGFERPKPPPGTLSLMVPVAFWVIRDDDLELAKSLIVGLTAAGATGVVDGSPSTASIAGIVGAVLNAARAARAKGAFISPLHYKLLLLLESMAGNRRLMNRGKILRGMLLSGDSRHSEGLYQFDSWSVRLGPDARSPEARMTSLHEAYHGFLNDSTAYGTVMHGVSALRHELPDHDHDAVLVALLERCVDAHETYAVYASLFLVGRGYPDPALLVHYPDYASLLVDTDAATSRLTNPVLRFQLVQSLIRAAMQVDCLPAFISTPTSGWQALAAEIEAPNERLELLLRPSSLATIEEQFRAWSEQQSEPSLREVLDATDVDDYDALTDERLDPATDAIGHFFYQASRSLLHVHCRNCLEFNGHQAHTRAFLHVIDEQLPVELRGTILAPAREGSILEDLVIDFADEQLVISPEPYSARWYRLDDLPEDRWADLAVGTPPHVFIAIRPLSRIRDQYKFEQEILHDVVDDEVVVSVRRMVVNDGPMFIEHVVVSSPERLERLTERLGQLGPVVISCSMSLLTDTAWTNRWWRAIRSATFSSILMDMNPITQLRRWAEQGELETALAIIDLSDGRRTHVVATLTPATDEDLIFLTPCEPTISAALTFEVRRLRAAGQSVSEDRSHIDRANHPMALVLSHLLREEPWFDFHGG